MRFIPKPERTGRVPSSKNAVWEIRPGKWAIGSHMLVEVTDSTSEAEDQQAVWRDDNQIAFRARPLPEELLNAYNDSKLIEASRFEGVQAWNRSMGIYELGHGVLLKAKRLGLGGSPAEPATMQLIRKEAPSVPVPEVLHHWRDEVWFCHFTIMRKLPGRPICDMWYALDPKHQQRLVEEVAVHMHTVAQIQSETSQRADGSPQYDDRTMNDTVMHEDRHDFVEPPNIDYYMTAKQIYDSLNAKDATPCAWKEMGDRFHLCHMDTGPTHFLVADDTGCYKPEWLNMATIPLEEQASMHISGIIDWEKAGFFLKYAVVWQFSRGITADLPYWEVKKSRHTATDFNDAVGEALVRLEWPDSKIFHPWRWVA